jgi:hypothetical protein
MKNKKVTLVFMTDEADESLQYFFDDVARQRMLNSNDNEEGFMIDIDVVSVDIYKDET